MHPFTDCYAFGIGVLIAVLSRIVSPRRAALAGGISLLLGEALTGTPALDVIEKTALGAAAGDYILMLVKK
jgi:hypothetical protein